MSSATLQREAGIETIPHVTPRDSTVMGLEGVLLGAHAEGVRNVLAVTGDPPHVGDYPGSRGVYEVDSIGLVQLLSSLNRGEDYVGKGIDAPTSFFVGVAVNPSADDLDLELERFRRKVDAGARFAMTQALFDVDLLDRFAERLGGAWPVPVLAGVWPLRSSRDGASAAQRGPGDQRSRHRARRPTGRRRRRAGGRTRARTRACRGARSRAAGIYVIPPFKQPLAALDLFDSRGVDRPGNRLGGALPSGHAFGGRYRWIDPMTLRHPRPKRGWPGDGRARRRPSAGRSARVRLRAPHARVRRRNEGGHRERRRLPACALRARRNVPVLKGRRDVAGAIAAAAAAAAEHGRERRGFEKLAALPAWIGDGDNLLGLFQPHESREHAGTSGCSRPASAGRACRRGCMSPEQRSSASRSPRSQASLPASPFSCSRSGRDRERSPCAQLSPGVFSPCSGSHSRSGAGSPSGCHARSAATGRPLLRSYGAQRDTRPDTVARRSPRRPRGEGGRGPADLRDLRAKGIDLQVMTTNVTHRRPHRMPWSSREFLFDPAELRLLFPERVVTWMEAHPAPVGEGRSTDRMRRRLDALAPLRPLPEPDDLPVVVAARMSLSFPLLIAAVPLPTRST